MVRLYEVGGLVPLGSFQHYQQVVGQEVAERLGKLRLADLLVVDLDPLEDRLIEETPHGRTSFAVGGLDVVREVEGEVERLLDVVELEGDRATAVAIDPAGNVLVGGRTGSVFGEPPTFDFAVVRYSEAGVLDSDFGDGESRAVADTGESDTTGDLALDANGRIVIGGLPPAA